MLLACCLSSVSKEGGEGGREGGREKEKGKKGRRRGGKGAVMEGRRGGERNLLNLTSLFPLLLSA